LTIKLTLETGGQVERDPFLTKAGLLPETKAKIAHNGRISLDTTRRIGEKRSSRNAPASRLKKLCRGRKVISCYPSHQAFLRQRMNAFYNKTEIEDNYI